MHETWKHIKFQQILNRIKENQYISGRQTYCGKGRGYCQTVFEIRSFYC